MPVMSEFAPSLIDLSETEWFDALDELADEHGHFEPLGDDHIAILTDAGPRLLVTFETYAEISATSEDDEPRGFHFVKRLGWSHLAIISRGPSMFRAHEIHRYFDRLIDDGFFEDFDRVMFYGNHEGGYAACAYSVCAPGAHVLALRPYATLTPRVASWDERYPHARRIDWTKRFGYAPDMIDGAAQATLVYDPRIKEDAMHAALFDRDCVLALRTPNLGAGIEGALDGIGLLNKLIVLTMDGTLTPLTFAKLYRKRRESFPYMRGLDQYLFGKGKLKLSRMLCTLQLNERPHRYFKRRLAQIDELEAET